MANGLTESGFVLESLSQNISDLVTELQTAFNNNNISAEDNARLGQMIKVLASRETKVWQALAQVYDVWTLNGCEASFLDEIFALNGVFRESATSGVGNAIVAVDNTSVNSTAITAGTEFTGSNSVTYTNTSDVLVSENVTAYKINANNVGLSVYTLSVVNLITNEVFSSTFTLSASTPTARLTFIQSIKTFLEGINESEVNLYIDDTNLILYYGFDSSYSLKGLEQNISLNMTPTLGTRYVEVECTAATKGYHPLYVGEITSMTPTVTGYISVTNIESFSSGSDVETDPAFIERAKSVTDSPRSSTRPAIKAGLLTNVSDIDRVYLRKTVTGGVVDLTWIVVGGETEAIANELYRTQSIETSYSGTESYDVDTDDGDTETIKFTRGTEKEISIRVTYSTKKGTSLTDIEKDNINTELTTLAEDWDLGGTVIFNGQLQAAVYNGVSSSSRFSAILVELKGATEDDTVYTSEDYTAADNIYPTLVSSNINFIKS
jgi:hypothetical protein